MTKWFDRAVDELEQQLEDGDISQEEFRKEMRSIRQEYEQDRQDAAQDAYNNY